MRFKELELKGAFVVEQERREDARGFFARAFCQRELSELGLNPAVAQVNVGHSRRKGTVRGLHFQYPPHAEVKLVRATRGALADVIVDLRPESPTFLRHAMVELDAESGRALYVPERFAHGCQALVDGTEFTYQASTFYAPGFEGGLSPLDPRLGIAWPIPPQDLSPKDTGWKPLDEALDELRRRMAA